MANALTALNPEIWKPMVQEYLNNMLISKAVANVKCEALLSSGDQVNFPYVNDVRVQSYTQGTDLTMDDLTAVADNLTIAQSKAATFVMDPVQEKQSLADFGSSLAYQSAYQLSNNIDQYVIDKGVTGANDSVTGGTLNTSTILAKMTDAYAQLDRNNATDGEMFAIVDPERAALLTQTFVANGFEEADLTLRNRFRGRAVGFDVYVSNNLKSSQTLSMATIPTATDTITVLGVTWTWVADGTTAAAGELNVGADAADAQAILVDAINNGSSLTADWTDVSVENRRKMQNAQLAAGTFSGNDSIFTAYGKIGATETFTPAGDVFGTETSNLLLGRKGAISMAIQMYPELYIREEPSQISKNYITHCLFDSAVFYRDKERVVSMTYNV